MIEIEPFMVMIQVAAGVHPAFSVSKRQRRQNRIFTPANNYGIRFAMCDRAYHGKYRYEKTQTRGTRAN